MWIEKVEEIRNSKNPDSAKNTIFEGILDSKFPDEEKTIPRLAHEAQLVVFAGEGTTAYTLQAAIYQLLANPAVFHKVKAEVTAALPDPEEVPSFAKVEKLPYLSAIIQETRLLKIPTSSALSDGSTIQDLTKDSSDLLEALEIALGT
ncbi:hypothetical protein COL922a_008958 [Colletotrichum nupharicola]|nr:hypothetical protein COL922a_008958 [Colletotrichum nupharicola]